MNTFCRHTLVLIVAVCGSASAEMYKWVDDQGRVHFGDKPPSQTTVEQLTIQKKKALADTTSQPAVGKPKKIPAVARPKQTDDEIRQLSKLSPEELKQKLLDMQENRNQAIQKTQQSAALQLRQQQERLRQEADQRNAESELFQKQQQAAREKMLAGGGSPKIEYDEDGNVKFTGVKTVEPQASSSVTMEDVLKRQKRRQERWDKIMELQDKYR